MKKILAFGASNSQNSINKKLAHFTATQLGDVDINFIDLQDWEMPLYGIDKEKIDGIPNKAIEFKKLVKECDGIIVSFAEHNGSFSTAFKNIYDWISRLEGKSWENQKMLILGTSPGERGAKSVMEHAMTILPHRGANIVAHFSLPSFNTNFSDEIGISDQNLALEYNDALDAFKAAIL